MRPGGRRADGGGHPFFLPTHSSEVIMADPRSDDSDDLSFDSSGVSVATVYRPCEAEQSAFPTMPQAMLERLAAKETHQQAEQNTEQNTDDEPPSREIFNPVTGAIVNLDDIDSVIRACAENRQIKADLEAFDATCRLAAAEFTKGATTKTRRIQGKTLRAKIEMPDEAWDSSILKEAHSSYPKWRDQYLRIGRVEPVMREVKKLVGMTTDDPAFESFRSMVLAANQGPRGLPRVTMEE